MIFLESKVDMKQGCQIFNFTKSEILASGKYNRDLGTKKETNLNEHLKF